MATIAGLHGRLKFANGFEAVLADMEVAVRHSCYGPSSMDASGVISQASCGPPYPPEPLVGRKATLSWEHGAGVLEAGVIIAEVQTAVNEDFTPFESDEGSSVGIVVKMVGHGQASLTPEPVSAEDGGWSKPAGEWSVESNMWPKDLESWYEQATEHQSCSGQSLAEKMDQVIQAHRANVPVPPSVPVPASTLPNVPPPEPTYERPKRRVRLQRRAADEPTSAKS